MFANRTPCCRAISESSCCANENRFIGKSRHTPTTIIPCLVLVITRFENCTSSVAQFHCHASALPAMMMPLAGVSQDQQAMYYLLQLAELATHLPVDACWVVVGVCPVPDPGLHSNSECLAQYGANRRVAYFSARPLLLWHPTFVDRLRT